MAIDWENFLDPYIQAVGELKIKLRGIRKQYRKQQKHSPIEFVTGRVKPIESIREKMIRRNISEENLAQDMQEIAQGQNVDDGEFDSDDDESSCSVWRTGAHTTPSTGACDTKSGKPLPPQAVERLLHRSCVPSSAAARYSQFLSQKMPSHLGPASARWPAQAATP